MSDHATQIVCVYDDSLFTYLLHFVHGSVWPFLVFTLRVYALQSFCNDTCSVFWLCCVAVEIQKFVNPRDKYPFNIMFTSWVHKPWHSIVLASVLLFCSLHCVSWWQIRGRPFLHPGFLKWTIFGWKLTHPHTLYGYGVFYLFIHFQKFTQHLWSTYNNRWSWPQLTKFWITHDKMWLTP